MHRLIPPLTLALAILACAAPRLLPTATSAPPTSAPQITASPQPTPTPSPAPTPTQTALPLPTATATPIPVTPGVSQVIYRSGGLELKAFLCVPAAAAPLPAVVYNHGGLGNQIGGAPRETCEALAQDGFVGFAPIRRPTVPLTGHLDDVLAAVDYVKSLPYVDSQRLGIIGFSRGGMLTFFAAAARPAEFDAIVIMAAAAEIEDAYQPLVEKISAPVLLLVAENDDVTADHVRVMFALRGALETAGKDVRLIVYPPYGNDGHRMFFEVGDYWSDVRRFLQAELMQP